MIYLRKSYKVLRETLNMDRSLYEEILKPLLVEDPTPAINWMKQQKLLRAELKCPHCSILMKWTKRSSIQDKYVWKCQVKECSKYKHYESIRKDSFFYRSKLSLQKWIEGIFYWCQELSVLQTVQLLNVSKVTVIDMFSFFREICLKHFERNPIKLGGPGTTVQIDESCFSHKPKHHRGRSPQNPLWVFGIVDPTSSPSLGYMEIVDSRNAETLLPIIRKVVMPGTIIHSDQWKAYRNIERDLGYTHHTVNHSVNFVDRTTGVHTQAVESYWNKHKIRIKRMIGCKREFLNSYLHEFMWSERNKNDKFHRFCETIARQYYFN
ncbi:uncharacterized protein [Palaemon carinicauda]|uniref:uncharacterized protein n=1 Tax=Palaemon carinicauda TaxID=392227 RepID=UPI0035B6A933